jgi:hypothetical protein
MVFFFRVFFHSSSRQLATLTFFSIAVTTLVSGLALLLMVRVEATGVFHLGVERRPFWKPASLSTNSYEYRKTSSLTEKESSRLGRIMTDAADIRCKNFAFGGSFQSG